MESEKNTNVYCSCDGAAHDIVELFWSPCGSQVSPSLLSFLVIYQKESLACPRPSAEASFELQWAIRAHRLQILTLKWLQWLEYLQALVEFLD